MSLTILDAIKQRKSVSKYQKDAALDHSTLNELIQLAGYSPSAYNLQNWHFIAVISDEGKALLKAAAFGQPQVETAAATFIVCGQVQAHKALQNRLSPSVKAGTIPANIADAWVAAASRSHEGNFQLQYEEAIRSGSLAAMTLMYAAQGMGLASGAMGGFDAEQIKKHFPLSDDDIPVMLVTVGIPEKNNWPQKERRPVEEILTLA